MQISAYHTACWRPVKDLDRYMLVPRITVLKEGCESVSGFIFLTTTYQTTFIQYHIKQGFQKRITSHRINSRGTP